MDESKRLVDMLQSIIKKIPPLKTLEQLARFRGDYDELHESEQLLLEMSSIESLKPRLTSIIFKFPVGLTSHITSNVVLPTAALEEFHQSQKFAKILKLVSSFGNHMNSGSKMAQSLGLV